MKQTNDNWYRLDNAAKIYPAVKSDKATGVFRLSALMYEEIDPIILQGAMIKTLERFPTFSTTMKKGFFWYYIEQNHTQPTVRMENRFPCVVLDTAYTDGYLFKVTYFGKKINLECFHSLTDGTGAMVFLKTLLFNYLTMRGEKIDDPKSLVSDVKYVSANETEDSFKKYYDSEHKSGAGENKSCHLKGVLYDPYTVHMTHGTLSAQKTAALAREKGATVTEYISSLILYSMYKSSFVENYEALKKRPLKISIPINLRRFFETETLRNFSLFLNVSIKTKGADSSFEDFLSQTSKQMKTEINRENLQKKFGFNVAAEKNIFFKVLPLFIKILALKIAYKLFGEKLYTTTLSNLGIIKIPDDMMSFVDKFYFVLSPTPVNPINATVITLGDKLTVTFSRCIEGSDVERNFFTYLTAQGLDVEIETN